MNRALLLLLVLALNDASGAPLPTLPRGEVEFRARCIGCHSMRCNRAGPKLEGILGRKAGAVADFTSYSESLRNSGIVWGEESLDAFLRDPNKLIPGTGMAAIGRIDSASERREILAFLRRQDPSIDICL